MKRLALFVLVLAVTPRLIAGRWPDAEATYREALTEHPGNGWAPAPTPPDNRD